MKRFAVTILVGIMVLGSTALGNEIALDEGGVGENEAIGTAANAELREELFDSEAGFFLENEIAEEAVEESADLSDGEGIVVDGTHETICKK